MSHTDYRPPTGTEPRSRQEWWRTYLAERSRRVAQHRMRWFHVLGIFMAAVAAVFLVPMFWRAEPPLRMTARPC